MNGSWEVGIGSCYNNSYPTDVKGIHKEFPECMFLSFPSPFLPSFWKYVGCKVYTHPADGKAYSTKLW